MQKRTITTGLAIFLSLASIATFSVQANASDTQYCQGMVCSDTPPTPDSNGGFAVVHPDGHVCGVIVGSIAYFGGNDRTMESEFMGCPIGSRIVLQTHADPVTGNVAGYHGSSPGASVQYDSNSGTFEISNSTNQSQPITLIIKDGVATDSTGRSFDTGSGLSTSTTLTPKQFQQLVNESNRKESAKTQQSNAKNKARELALLTPGFERCVTWSGYLENGRECSFASSSDSSTVRLRSVLNSLTESESATLLIIDSQTVSTNQDSITVYVKPTNEFVTPKLLNDGLEAKGSPTEMASLALKVESDMRTAADIEKSVKKFDAMRVVTASSQIKLPNAKLSEETSVSLTPEVCSSEGTQVSRLKKGTCTVSLTITSSSGNSFTSSRSFTFR